MSAAISDGSTRLNSDLRSEVQIRGSQLQRMTATAKAQAKVQDEQQTQDLTSHLSIIANSAVVEIWTIDEDILGLLPFVVQRIVLSRIKAQQKTAQDAGSPRDRARFSKDAVIKRIKEQQKKADASEARSQFKYSRTGCLISKVHDGSRVFGTEAEYYDSMTKVLQRDMDDLPKNRNDLKGVNPAEKMVMKRQQMIKPAMDCGCSMNCTTSEKAFTACKVDQALRTEIHDDLEVNVEVLNHDLH